MNGEQREAQEKYVKNLTSQGKLLPSASPFGAAVVMVRKPSGGWRMAFDFRNANEILKKQHYTFRSVRGCVDSLSKAKYFRHDLRDF